MLVCGPGFLNRLNHDPFFFVTQLCYVDVICCCVNSQIKSNFETCKVMDTTSTCARSKTQLNVDKAASLTCTLLNSIGVGYSAERNRFSLPLLHHSHLKVIDVDGGGTMQSLFDARADPYTFPSKKAGQCACTELHMLTGMTGESDT